MKKLLFLFLFISTFSFAQQKELYKTITYNNMVTLFNTNLKLKGESLEENIKRCNHIIADAKQKDDENTALAFTLFYKALEGSKDKADQPFVSIYKDDTAYNFYSDKNEFVGRVYKEDLNEAIAQNGDNDNTYLSKYFYMITGN